MSRKHIAFITAFLLAGAVAGWLFWREPEQGRIARQMDLLVRTLEESAGGSELRALAGANKAANFFSDYCAVEAPEVRIRVNDRHELAASFAQALSLCDSLDIGLSNRSITLSQDSQSATMNLRASFSGMVAGNREHGGGEYLLEWVKREGQWQIQRVLALQ